VELALERLLDVGGGGGGDDLLRDGPAAADGGDSDVEPGHAAAVVLHGEALADSDALRVVGVDVVDQREAFQCGGASEAAVHADVGGDVEGQIDRARGVIDSALGGARGGVGGF